MISNLLEREEKNKLLANNGDRRKLKDKSITARNIPSLLDTFAQKPMGNGGSSWRVQLGVGGEGGKGYIGRLAVRARNVGYKYVGISEHREVVSFVLWHGWGWTT